jgi:hypothetical protein
MCCAPREVGKTPDTIVVRAGAQTGALDQALANIMPFEANASKLGVSEKESP